MEFIIELIVLAFVEILFNTVMVSIGASARWLLNFGRVPYETLLKRGYNGIRGIAVLVLVILVIVAINN